MQLGELRQVILHPSAIAEPVRKSLFVAIERNRDAVADVIFPVIGPAIRRAIAQALQQMVDTTNRLISNSISLRAVRWRIEAARTGRSVAEIAIAHSLLYDVEQVFLIHRESGLLIRHVARPTVVSQPPEVVSGMLTGIRDFVRDSFGHSESEDDGVHRLEVGDRTVWVEQRGPAVLAAVVRGVGPSEIGLQLRSTLVQIVADHGPRLRAFDGDSEALAEVEPALKDCLRSQPRPPKNQPRGGFYALAVILLVVIGYFVADQWQWRQRAAEAVVRLGDAPGYRLLHHHTGWTQLELKGLRDPLAPEFESVVPTTLVAASELRVTWLVARDPRLAVEHIKAHLVPPPEVSIELTEEGTLVMTGTASADWYRGATWAARTIDGVRRLDTSRLARADQVRLRAAIRDVQGHRVSFAVGASEPQSLAEVESLRSAVEGLDRAAWASGARLHLIFNGQADPSGTPAFNRAISRRRAETVANALGDLSALGIRTTVVGVGTASISDGATSNDRSVRVSVRLSTAP